MLFLVAIVIGLCFNIISPFSTGECGRMGAPKRREIGHGNLANVHCVQYCLMLNHSIQLTWYLEALESNGSSHGNSLCWMFIMTEAGVPIKDHVAGVAMGLILDGNKFAILTDILGDEDHL